MSDWVQHILSNQELSLLTFPAAMLLGLLTSLGSCCNYAAYTAVAGFAASRESYKNRDVLFASLGLMVGTVISLTFLGAVIGLIGREIGNSLGYYGQILTGLIIIILGMYTLDLVPFSIPKPNFAIKKLPRGVLGSSLFGLTIGSASISCTLLCCGPLLPFVMGMALIKGESLWGAAILAFFAIGYSIPLSIALLGIGWGKMNIAGTKLSKPIKLIAGVLLVIAGFWVLLSV
ncbi:MAG: hypothetical protein GY855_02385 [candidate division Zixibacteria bacterium]|nr:hypothetical protein [candidate division Zixibacteria bacterium]